jgi:N-hydroxyarylamine O-acetyltransferase
MNTSQYLDRIKYAGELKPNLKVLSALQKNHLLNVPFENLDIHYRIPIELKINNIYNKIVLKNRGGFCYELNGLFYELLKSLKFNAIRISARVYDDNGEYSPEFDHFAIIVNLKDSEYIVDVGFGDFVFEPLELVLNTVQNDPSGDYVIDKYNDDYFRVNKLIKGQLVPEYIFKKTERTFIDFEDRCLYHQTNPNSHFKKKRLISMLTRMGRMTISGNTLKVKENNVIKEKKLKDEPDFYNELSNLFNVTLKQPTSVE